MHPIFRRPKFFQGRPLRGSAVKDIVWLNPMGKEMSDDEWGTHFVKTLGVLLYGEMADVRDWHGQPIRDDTFLLLLNASPKSLPFVMPDVLGSSWQPMIDTREESGLPKRKRTIKPGQRYQLLDRSFALLKRVG
jgi:glycogen operon protein